MDHECWFLALRTCRHSDLSIHNLVNVTYNEKEVIPPHYLVREVSKTR